MQTTLGNFKAKDGYLVNYKLYTTHNPICIVLGIHGGGFYDGNETWNKSQSEDFANNGINIMQLDFRQNTTEQAIFDLTDACYFLQKMYPNLPFGVIGTSSGGFYSLVLSTNIPSNVDISFAIHLCPVSKPYQRFYYLQTNDHKYKQKLMKNQLLHFGDERNMRAKEKLITDVFNIPTLLICGNNDANVPEQINKNLFNNEHITSLVLEGGHEICYKKDERVTDEIIKFLKSKHI